MKEFRTNLISSFLCEYFKNSKDGFYSLTEGTHTFIFNESIEDENFKTIFINNLSFTLHKEFNKFLRDRNEDLKNTNRNIVYSSEFNTNNQPIIRWI